MDDNVTPDAATFEDRLSRLESVVDEITTHNVLLPDLSKDMRQVREALPGLTAALEKLDRVETRVETVDNDSKRARRRFFAYCLVLALVGGLTYASLAVQRSSTCDKRNEATLAQSELLETIPLPSTYGEQYRLAFDRYLSRIDIVDCSLLRNPLG